MTAKPRGPSEAQRAFWALSGVRVPAVGAKGWWMGQRGSPPRWVRAQVQVVRVSASGKTVWVRFVGTLPRGFLERLLHGRNAEYVYRYERDFFWRPRSGGPYGDLLFP